MLRQQFEHQHVANSIENERFELKNVSNTLETAASSSKMLLIPQKCCKFYGKWEVPTPKCCKDSWNGSFQLQNAWNGKDNGQKADPKKKTKRKKNQTIGPKVNCWCGGFRFVMVPHPMKDHDSALKQPWWRLGIHHDLRIPQLVVTWWYGTMWGPQYS